MTQAESLETGLGILKASDRNMVISARDGVILVFHHGGVPDVSHLSGWYKSTVHQNCFGFEAE